MPTSKGYRLGEAAEEDLAAILRFTAQRWSIDQARRYLAGIEKTFDDIVAYPEMVRERSEFSPPVRVKHFKSHIIVYRNDEDLVLIERILHGSSDWQSEIGEDT